MKVEIKQRERGGVKEMKIFESISIMLLLVISIVFSANFLTAYMNGGKVIMDINSIGEAPYELVIITVALVCGVITLWRVTKRIGG